MSQFEHPTFHELNMAFTGFTIPGTYALLLCSGSAIGCPDLDPPDRATLKRFGDRSEIRCHDGVQKWEVKCVGNTWVGETEAHCTAPWQDNTTPSSIGPLSVGGSRSNLD